MNRMVLLCLIVSFVACSKRDKQHWNQKAKCDVAQQTYNSSAKDDFFEHGNQLKKTYYGNGLPKTLSVVFLGNFFETDTLEYFFDYDVNLITVHANSRGYSVSDGEYRQTEYDFVVKLDPVLGYATKIGDEVMQYENKRLTWFGPHKLEYDNKGNLVYIKQHAQQYPGTRNGLQFKYDLSKKAGTSEFYLIPNTQFGTNFCLAEIMAWVPLQSPYRRIQHLVVWGIEGSPDYIAGKYNFTNHKYSADGKLIQFNLGETFTIKNTWQCAKF